MLKKELMKEWFSCTPTRKNLESLLAKGVEADLRHPKFGYTLLQHLLLTFDFYKFEECFAAIQCLVENGADLNASDNWFDLTAFQRALFSVPEEVLLYLLKNNANLDMPIRGKEDVYQFIMARSEWPLIQWVLNNSPNKGKLADPNGFTGIHWAVRYKDYNLLKKLIAHDVSVNDKDTKAGLTPIYYAILNNDTQAICILHAAGAELNITCGKDPFKYTPLQYAFFNGCGIVAKQLLSLGAESAVVQGWLMHNHLINWEALEEEEFQKRVSKACRPFGFSFHVSTEIDLFSHGFHCNFMAYLAGYRGRYAKLNNEVELNLHEELRFGTVLSRLRDSFLFNAKIGITIDTLDKLKYLAELGAVFSFGSLEGVTLFQDRYSAIISQMVRFDYAFMQEFIQFDWVNFSNDVHESFLNRLLSDQVSFIDNKKIEFPCIENLVKKSPDRCVDIQTFFYSLHDKEIADFILAKLIEKESLKEEEGDLKSRALKQLSFRDAFFYTLYEASKDGAYDIFSKFHKRQINFKQLSQRINNILDFCIDFEKNILDCDFRVLKDQLVVKNKIFNLSGYFKRPLSQEDNSDEPSVLLFVFETLERLGLLEKYVIAEPNFLFNAIDPYYQKGEYKENVRACLNFLINWYIDNRTEWLSTLTFKKQKILTRVILAMNAHPLLDKFLRQVTLREAVFSELSENIKTSLKKYKGVVSGPLTKEPSNQVILFHRDSVAHRRDVANEQQFKRKRLNGK